MIYADKKKAASKASNTWAVEVVNIPAKIVAKSFKIISDYIFFLIITSKISISIFIYL